jgi:glycosyltransferase involved in cell wall biosynthesis
MNVLMISSDYHLAGGIPSGLGTHVSGLAQSLIPLGHKVMVATFTNGNRIETSDRGVRLVAFGAGDLVGIDLRRGAGKLREINKLLSDNLIHHLEGAQFTPDVVHAHDSYGIYAAKALGEHYRCPLIGTVHMLHQSLHDALGMLAPRDFADGDATLCGKSTGLIAVSEYIARDIAERGLRPANEISVIHNGLAVKSVSEAAPQIIENEPREYRLVFAGRLNAQKGLMYLLQSAIRVSRAFPEARYSVVGGMQDPRFEAAIEEFFLANEAMRACIQILPPQPREQLFDLYRRSVAAIVPSVYEPFGYAALEPMSCGVPVIATSVGGLTEIICDGVEGILVDCPMRDGLPSPDIDQLTAAQLLLLRNPGWSRAMGQNGRQTVTQKFLLSQMVHKTLDVYRRHAPGGRVNRF